MAALPSTPITAAPLGAMGSVKLPSPQKKSAMRSRAAGRRRDIARRTRIRLMNGLTCVNSIGPKGIVMPNSGIV